MMKKILLLVTILLFGTITFAAVGATNLATPTTTTSQPLSTEPDYIAVKGHNQTMYYDKYGKLIARDKYLNNYTYFYNNVGQLEGKSVKRADKTFYYNQIGSFMGVCDVKGLCQDKDFVATGKIPPLPIVKNFVPYFDAELLNPSKAASEEE